MSEELGRVAVSAVADGSAVRIDGGPHGVCVVRLGDRFFAVDDRCSHALVRLSEGDVDPDECTIECWKHGSAFSLEDGKPQSLPATQPVAVYSVVRDGDELVVKS